MSGHLFSYQHLQSVDEPVRADRLEASVSLDASTGMLVRVLLAEAWERPVQRGMRGAWT